jgi:hypothetical protein
LAIIKFTSRSAFFGGFAIAMPTTDCMADNNALLIIRFHAHGIGMAVSVTISQIISSLALLSRSFFVTLSNLLVGLEQVQVQVQVKLQVRAQVQLWWMSLHQDLQLRWQVGEVIVVTARSLLVGSGEAQRYCCPLGNKMDILI